MTALLNATANESESENAVFLVQVWLNGIVEAFDGNCELPIKAADHFHPLPALSKQTPRGVMAICFTTHG